MYYHYSKIDNNCVLELRPYKNQWIYFLRSTEDIQPNTLIKNAIRRKENLNNKNLSNDQVIYLQTNMYGNPEILTEVN
jgi:hypothetical protein